MVKRFEARACGGILAITRTRGEGEGHLIHPSVRGKLGAERCSALQPGDHEGHPYSGDGHLIRHSVRTGPTGRLAGSENPVGLTLFLGIFDRCGKRALPASATGSAKPQFSSRGRLWARSFARQAWNVARYSRVGMLPARRDAQDDLIVSASPDFLLRPICEELGVSLIATPMNPYTGKIHGLNCHDEEKVRRFRLEVPEGHIENFYSDSLSDSPLAKLADRAWLVKKGKLSPWPEE